MIDAGLKVGRPGVPVLPMPAGASPEAIMAMLPEILQTTTDELGAFERTPEAMRKHGGFGGLQKTPLVVIRRGRTAQPPRPDDVAWQRSQEALLELSANSRLLPGKERAHGSRR